MKQIIVMGSINMDIVNRVERHPLPGETIKGLKTEFNPGGKGANQAVAAARAGGHVSMVGAIGSDPFAEELLSSLQKDDINIENMIKKDGKSGLAFITVDNLGENSIILEEGANGKFTIDDVISFDKIEENSVIVLQNEIPWETTEYMINQAHEYKIPVYLNPAPAIKVKESTLARLRGLFVNETEAETLLGYPLEDEKTVAQAATELLKMGVAEVVITLGKNGSYYADQSGETIFTPAYQVEVVDTTAAGDTFIGAYIFAKVSGESVKNSLRFATAASSLTVMKEGAQQSIPTQQQIRTAIK